MRKIPGWPELPVPARSSTNLQVQSSRSSPAIARDGTQTMWAWECNMSRHIRKWHSYIMNQVTHRNFLENISPSQVLFPQPATLWSTTRQRRFKYLDSQGAKLENNLVEQILQSKPLTSLQWSYWRDRVPWIPRTASRPSMPTLLG